MAIEDFFEGTCDIYHIISAPGSPGWGLPAGQEFSYPENPDISNSRCHFHVGSQTAKIEQTQPANLLAATQKLSLPLNTDIRLNDKVVDKSTGLAYTANVPRNIRDHHKIVILRRTAQQEAL